MESGKIENAQPREAPLSRSEDQHEGSQSEENTTSNSWAIQVEERFQSEQNQMQLPSSDVCIYRVPNFFLGCKQEAYLPEFVSLGPFHHNKLSAMKDHKLEAVQKTLKRIKPKSIADLLNVIKHLEKKIRDCYEDHAIEYDGETLAWMMMMDGCFILEFLRAVDSEENVEEFSIIFCSSSQNIIHWRILGDILKLENQIPLFILISILKLELETDDRAVWKLIFMLLRFPEFQSYPFCRKTSVVDVALGMERYISKGACHLLDLCRETNKDSLTQFSSDTDYLTEASPVSASATAAESRSASASATTAECLSFVDKCVHSSTLCCNLPKWLCSSNFMNVSCWMRGPEQGMASPTADLANTSIPRAELLHKAGIRFKTCVEGNLRFVKRTFGSGTLFLPSILVNDGTETILRNLIILEEYQRLKKKHENVFSQYMSFMNNLIDSEKDVARLTKEEIIINKLGHDQEIADLFNNLHRGTTIGGLEQFNEVAQQVKAEYDSKMKVLMSQFIEEHCSKPWYIVSLVAAILILGMTAVQTLYSVKK